MDTLIKAFEAVFRGQVYKHRLPYVGDSIAAYLYEDLYHLGYSEALNRRVDQRQVAVNIGNQIKGKKGDGVTEPWVVSCLPFLPLQCPASSSLVGWSLTLRLARK